MRPADAGLPVWARWRAEAGRPGYTLGVEEEAMLLDPGSWELAHRSAELLEAVPAELRGSVGAETQGSVIEIQTGVAGSVAEAIDELCALRARLAELAAGLGLRIAAAGTHPFAVWQDIKIAAGDRYRFVHGSMQELARREPTFAMHVHVAVPDAEAAIRVHDRIRVHLPVLLALSASSPYWQGRDTGLASARTPLFQAFPRVGIPRAFGSYGAYVEAVDLLVRTDAIPDPSFLWWDVRQPALGTVEIRIMDAQPICRDAAPLLALTACLVRLEAEEGFAGPAAIAAQEAIEENRFLAARDGVDAELIDPVRDRRIPLPELLEELLGRCEPHARELGCAAELAAVAERLASPAARRQIQNARAAPSLAGLVELLADRYVEGDERPGAAGGAAMS